MTTKKLNKSVFLCYNIASCLPWLTLNTIVTLPLIRIFRICLKRNVNFVFQTKQNISNLLKENIILIKAEFDCDIIVTFRIVLSSTKHYL